MQKSENTLHPYKTLIEDISGCTVVEEEGNTLLIQPPLSKAQNWGWGLAEWTVLELGNGDVCGFYWKIGGEGKNPLVCALHHDDWALVPWSSNLISFFELIVNNDEDSPFSSDFWFDKEELEDILSEYDIPTNKFKKSNQIKNLEDAMLIDSQSPICLKLRGDQYCQEKNMDLAKECYLKALSILPEYGDASFALGMLYRSQRKDNLAIPQFIDSFAAPLYFSKAKEKSLLLLSRYKDDGLYDTSDPVWKRRQSLKLDDGEKKPIFHKIINEIIEEYIQLKEFRRAIGLRLFLGAFACSDENLTHRYQLKDHQRLLEQNLEVCDMVKRLPLQQDQEN